MFYLGEMIDAQSAHRLGIINHLFPADKFEAAVTAFAKKIAEGPQLAIRAVKQSIFAREKDALMEALERESRPSLNVSTRTMPRGHSRLHGKASAQVSRKLNIL